MDLAKLEPYKNKWTLIKSLICFLKKTAGREKFFKLIGYIAKCKKEFIKAFLLNPKDQSPSLKRFIEKCDITYDQTSLTRKCLRLGLVFQDFQKLVQAKHKLKELKADSSKPKEVVKRAELGVLDAYLTIVGNLFDNLQFICQIKIINNPLLDDTANFISGFCSLISCFINISNNYKDFKKVKAKQIEQTDEDVLANKTSKKEAIMQHYLEILRSSCDIPKALTDMQFDISSKFVSPLGLISGFLGCYNNWELVE